eukprot:1948942-Rhodomonas_salina.1
MSVPMSVPDISTGYGVARAYASSGRRVASAYVSTGYGVGCYLEPRRQERVGLRPGRTIRELSTAPYASS